MVDMVPPRQPLKYKIEVRVDGLCFIFRALPGMFQTFKLLTTATSEEEARAIVQEDRSAIEAEAMGSRVLRVIEL